MTLAASFDSTNSRVVLAATSLPNLNGLPIYIERQVSGSAWTYVRSAAPAYPNATTFNVNDYEFSPNVLNSYRVRTDVLYDLFGRSSSSSWGSADSGQTYTQTGGTGTDFNVAAGIGTIKQSTANVIRTETVTVSVDSETFGDVGVSATVAGASIFGGFVNRYANTNNYYYAVLEFAIGGALTLTLNKIVSGTPTVLGTYVVGTYTVGNLYRIHFKVLGTSVFATAWDNTAGSEPSAWQIAVSDSSLSAGNIVGAWAKAATGNTNSTATVNFDNLHTGDLSTVAMTFASLGTASVTPAQLVPYLKFPLRPFLNRQVTICNWGAETRVARGAVYQILGRSLGVAVTELREARTFTMQIVAQDVAEADAIALAFSFGDIVYIQTPDASVYCGLMRRSYPKSCYGFVGDTVHARPVNGTPTYLITVPITHVAPPDYSLLGSGATWGGIIAAFATWSAVIANFPTWQDVLQYVSNPSNELVG